MNRPKFDKETLERWEKECQFEKENPMFREDTKEMIKELKRRGYKIIKKRRGTKWKEYL